ncbi:Sex peptide receptor [Schistosoma japonicum]|nr:Sex peptide receptor [Schistosoma japonicum]KAH8849956.1 Sex peptide receptor [Schistosoma japonicum]
MSVPVCSMNTTSDIYLLNQDLINAANIAIQLNIEYNSFHYLTSNITSLRNFQLYNLPLIEQYIHFHGTTHMSYCSHVTNFQSNFYLRNILQTYVQPFVIFFTIITNCLISIVLTYPTMRNSTNIILLGIAICDLLTVLLPLPVYLCFLTSLLIMALRRFIQNRQKLLKIKNENRSILLNKNTTNSYMKKKHKENLKLEEISIIDNELKLSVNTPLDTTKITNTLTSTNNSLRKMPTRNNSTDTDSTSKMMLVILGIFLFTEIPTTVCLCIYAFITLLDIHPPSAFYEVSDNELFDIVR